MKMNKKAGVELIGLIVVLVLAFIAIMFIRGEQSPPVKFVGETQIELMDAFELKERTYQYIDMSIAEAKRIAEEELNGERITDASIGQYPCGFVVYPVWGEDTNNANCFIDYEAKFKKVFKNEFYKLIRKRNVESLKGMKYNVDIKEVNGKLAVDVQLVGAVSTGFYIKQSEYLSDIQAQGTINEPITNSEGYLEVGGLDRASRGTNTINKIVIYNTETSDLETYFEKLRNEGKSVHYAIEKDGKIYQFINENMAAKHTGCDEENVCTENYDESTIAIAIVNCGKSSDSCKVAECSEKIKGECWEEIEPVQINALAKLITEIELRNTGVVFSDDDIIDVSELNPRRPNEKVSNLMINDVMKKVEEYRKTINRKSISIEEENKDQQNKEQKTDEGAQ